MAGRASPTQEAADPYWGGSSMVDADDVKNERATAGFGFWITKDLPRKRIARVEVTLSRKLTSKSQVPGGFLQKPDIGGST